MKPLQAKKPAPPAEPTAASAPFAKLTSARWREDLIPQIEQKLAAAKGRDAALQVDLEIAELSLALGHDGAEEAVTKHREARRVLSIEVEGLEAAIRRAKAEQTAAEDEEHRAKIDRRIDELKKIATRRVTLARQIDQWLLYGNVLARDFLTTGMQVGPYRDLSTQAPIQVPSGGRLRSAEFMKRVVASNEALSALFELGPVPTHQRQSLASLERSAFLGVLSYETAADRERAELARCQEAVEAEHPELTIDPMKEYPEGEVERLAEEFNRLVEERREAMAKAKRE